MSATETAVSDLVAAETTDDSAPPTADCSLSDAPTWLGDSDDDEGPCALVTVLRLVWAVEGLALEELDDDDLEALRSALACIHDRVGGESVRRLGVRP